MQRYTNHLWELIELYPDKSWNWDFISGNPNITWKIIQDNPYKDWDWIWISENPNITWEIIKNNPDKDWDWGCISINPNITWEIIQDNPDKDWDWGYISYNKFEKDKSIVTRNQKKAKRCIKDYIDDECLCPTAIAELISDFVY